MLSRHNRNPLPTAGHGLFEQMEIHEVELLRRVLELAETEGITTYDASHLWLARTLDLDLVNLDGELARAAAKGRREEHGPAERS